MPQANADQTAPQVARVVAFPVPPRYDLAFAQLRHLVQIERTALTWARIADLCEILIHSPWPDHRTCANAILRAMQEDLARAAPDSSPPARPPEAGPASDTGMSALIDDIEQAEAILRRFTLTTCAILGAAMASGYLATLIGLLPQVLQAGGWQ